MEQNAIRSISNSLKLIFFHFSHENSLDERLFRMHCKRMAEKFTNSVIDAAQRELTVETANKIKSLAGNTLNLIKPETIKLLSKTNTLIDKHFTIPETLPLSSENMLQNRPEMNDYGRKCEQDIAEIELVYKQQAIMMNHLLKEKELYDTKLMEEAQIDMSMCDLFEKHFSDSTTNTEDVDNVVQMLKDIDVQATI